MTPIEIIALILVIFTAIKLITALLGPKNLISYMKTIWGYPALTIVVSLALAVLVLTFLLEELTIVQIFAVFAFLALLMVSFVAPYLKEMLPFCEKIVTKDLWKTSWIAWIIWLALTLWVVYALFF